MKVMITGAAGYVGWSVLNVLAGRPEVDEILVYDNFARRNYGLLLADKPRGRRKVRVTVDEILNGRGMQRAVQGADCVCHLAALAPSPFNNDNPHAFDQVNHWGTAEACYAVEDGGVPRMVYVSSGAVYGFPDGIADVTTEPMPANAYGSSKLAGERHVQRLSAQRATVILRAGTVYGLNPVARFDTFVNRFVLDAALGRALHVHGSGEQARPVVHVDALAHAVTKAILGEVESGVHDVVETNATVNEAVGVLREYDATVEFIHTNQQARLRDLRVEPTAVHGLLPPGDRQFSDVLPEMLEQIRLS
ncbi:MULTISPECIES: NAD(P)-dependent oxidoreductase [unclassified Wenzhouxiangella]|uniref:NAD-dependent epimerase/dehydratase family protein n=1 Tax=unclassified Wenzhouxiangella TaxID=2613841 RepID=UPI0015F29128|nr:MULTISPECIES: SDR family oxidoreductase [unclassified Wenzhouxiangella]